MKEKNFDEIYEKLHLECGNELKLLKQAYKKDIIKKLFKEMPKWLIIVIISLALAIKKENYIFLTFLVVFSCTLFIIILIISDSKITKEYKKTFKSKIINYLVKSYSNNLNYSSINRINMGSYLNAEFEEIDSLNSEDYISGTLKQGNRIVMSEIRARKTSMNNYYGITVFKGIFGEIKIDTFIKEPIKVRRNTSQNLQLNEKIEMDSTEFERIYNVFCKNKIIAMQFLTADVMQYLVNLEKMFPEITIKEDKIYIRIKCRNMFEDSWIKDSLDYQTLKEYYDVLDSIFSITEMILKNVKESGV